jgi:hypothetical protein
MPVISVLRTLRQEDKQFDTTLGYLKKIKSDELINNKSGHKI